MGIEIIFWERVGKHVWADKEFDELRKERCVCLNCDRKNDKPPYSSCYLAQKFYKLCLENNSSIAMTKCGAEDKSGELLYKPIKKSISVDEYIE